MKKEILIVSILVTLLYSCNRKDTSNKDQSVSYKVELVKAGKKKSFELDEDTRYNAFYLWTFPDKKGKEYLSFLNYRTNQILFYDFNTCAQLFKIEMEKEGVHGVNQITGYYIQDFDNMYISSIGTEGLIKIDTTRKIKQKILYGSTDEGYKIVPSYKPSSYPYIPPVYIDGKLFVIQQAVDQIYSAEKTPITVTIDTINRAYEQMPFTFGETLSDEHFKYQRDDKRFSREYNNENFIYSFYKDESIYVTSIDHQAVRKLYGKSKFINKLKIENPLSDIKQDMRRVLEMAHYGDMIYDKYRDVYYRFVYPEVELDPNRDYYQKVLFGRSLFSVIIFDKDFNIIGETLFPKDIYNSYVFFVHSDGLYISSDYQINFDQSEDQLTFELFKLVDNGKEHKNVYLQVL